nr:hypothetical protein [Pseudoruegeria aquimaris]
MGVRVLCVVAMLVMDCCDIPGNAFAQSLGKGPCQRLPLFRGGFHRQSYHKALTDAPFAPLGLFFGLGGSLWVGVSRKSFLNDHPRRLWASDVSEMRRSLAEFGDTGFICALL